MQEPEQAIPGQKLLHIESDDTTLLRETHPCTVFASSLLELEEQLSLSLQDYDGFHLPSEER